MWISNVTEDDHNYEMIEVKSKCRKDDGPTVQER